MPDFCPAVPGSNPASPQPTADCRSPGGLPLGMALGCGLTSVRGNRGENYENEPLVCQKHVKKKKKKLCNGVTVHLPTSTDGLLMPIFSPLPCLLLPPSLPSRGTQIFTYLITHYFYLHIYSVCIYLALLISIFHLSKIFVVFF